MKEKKNKEQICSADLIGAANLNGFRYHGLSFSSGLFAFVKFLRSNDISNRISKDINNLQVLGRCDGISYHILTLGGGVLLRGGLSPAQFFLVCGVHTVESTPK